MELEEDLGGYQDQAKALDPDPAGFWPTEELVKDDYEDFRHKPPLQETPKRPKSPQRRRGRPIGATKAATELANLDKTQMSSRTRSGQLARTPPVQRPTPTTTRPPPVGRTPPTPLEHQRKKEYQAAKRQREEQLRNRNSPHPDQSPGESRRRRAEEQPGVDSPAVIRERLRREIEAREDRRAEAENFERIQRSRIEQAIITLQAPLTQIQRNRIRHKIQAFENSIAEKWKNVEKLPEK